jgi:hypothetical protein
VSSVHPAECRDPICPEPHEVRRTHLPTINAEVLGRAIGEHRFAMFDPVTHVAGSHLCFDDCADDIYARCLELIAK